MQQFLLQQDALVRETVLVEKSPLLRQSPRVVLPVLDLVVSSPSVLVLKRMLGWMEDDGRSGYEENGVEGGQRSLVDGVMAEVGTVTGLGGPAQKVEGG